MCSARAFSAYKKKSLKTNEGAGINFTLGSKWFFQLNDSNLLLISDHKKNKYHWRKLRIKENWNRRHKMNL